MGPEGANTSASPPPPRPFGLALAARALETRAFRQLLSCGGGGGRRRRETGGVGVRKGTPRPVPGGWVEGPWCLGKLRGFGPTHEVFFLCLTLSPRVPRLEVGQETGAVVERTATRAEVGKGVAFGGTSGPAADSRGGLGESVCFSFASPS